LGKLTLFQVKSCDSWRQRAKQLV